MDMFININLFFCRIVALRTHCFFLAYTALYENLTKEHGFQHMMKALVFIYFQLPEKNDKKLTRYLRK